MLSTGEWVVQVFSFGEVCGGGPWFGKCAGVALGGGNVLGGNMAVNVG